MVTEQLEDIRAALDAVGITATVDPPKVHPPGAWLSARRLETRTLSGGWSVAVDVYLIARDNGIPAALEALDDMLIRALKALDRHDFDLDSSDLGQSVTLPHGGGPLPAYRLTITT